MSSTSARLSDMIVLDIVLKIWIELIESRNDNAMEKFYRLWTFQKVRFWLKFQKFPKFSKITIPSREPLLLYELFERKPG